MYFQIIISIILIIILIIWLTLIGMTINNNQKDTLRVTPVCPDYWIINKENKCVNVKSLGKCPPQAGSRFYTMDFSQAPFIGDSGNCAKYNWAKTCGIAWENITYGVDKSPCDT